MKIRSNVPLFFSLFLILFAGLTGCDNTPPKTTKQEPTVQKSEREKTLPSVRIAINATIKSSSIILAQELGFFKDQGVQVELIVKKTGVAAYEAMQKGETNLATVPEALAAYDTLNHDNWQIISSINRSDTNVLIGRKDHGIDSIASLQGKKIGLKLKSSSTYWLSKLLTYNSLFKEDVTLIDGQPGTLVEMIKNGATDAVITWHPHAYKIQKILDDNAFSYAAQQNQDMYWVLLAQRQWLLKNPETSIAIIKALQTSAQYITNNDKEAKKTIARYLQLEQDYVNFEWPLHSFVNELPQNLLQVMEEEMQWKLGQQEEPQLKPNLSSYIYSDALSTVDTDAVGILR